MSDFRENYFKARDIIAKELKEKHNLEESYKDDNRLTLDSTDYSIHLTFYIPDAENISVSNLGQEPGHGESFMSLVSKRYPERNEMISFLKGLFLDINQNDFSIQAIKKKLNKKITFIENEYPNYLKTINI